jgi:hypothetical protein
MDARPQAAEALSGLAVLNLKVAWTSRWRPAARSRQPSLPSGSDRAARRAGGLESESITRSNFGGFVP